MGADPSRVIISTAVATDHTQVHHRDFAEIRVEGETPAIAATNLANQLTRTLDSALTPWRRDAILQAIDDVQAFAGSGSAEP